MRVQRYLFASHERVARVVAARGGGAGLTDAILEYVRGNLSYGGLRRRMLLRFPMTILKMAREECDACKLSNDKIKSQSTMKP